jgi:CubicO group peptidase (beta-lactamase class C family)
MRTLAITVLLAVMFQAEPVKHQAEVDRIFSAFNTHAAGCAIGVAHNGSVVLKSGYGMADLERNVPITADTVFESGSVAKQFTAAALMLLAKQGKISLDDAMRKYLPELPDYGAPLTIRHVLSHVSGLRDWRPIADFAGFPEGTHVYNNRDLLEMAAKQRGLNFDPGTDYSYTNIGYNIATILIERALGNGKTFQAFTQENIFAPLGMTHTRWRDDFRALAPNRALAYGRSGDTWMQQTPIENIIGAGGLLTTVGDLLLWNENFKHARVGGPELVRALQTPATLTNGRTIAYAAGLRVIQVDGLREISHAGATGGYHTWLGRYPDQDVSVAVLCNSGQSNIPARLGRETARLWTGASTAKSSAPYAVDSAKLQSLAGMYRKVRDNTVAEIRWREGKLMFGSEDELIPTAPDKFVAAESEYKFTDGTPVRLRVVTPYDDVLYERVDPARPTAAELVALVGEYENPETASTLVVAIGSAPGELTYRIRTNPLVRLRATFRDAFATSSGSSIRFIRDAGGKVVALSAGDDRRGVWDLRFTRVR